jgi:uncharacterized phiE125 gp8 family phage protein
MPAVLIEPPSSEPLSLLEAKNYLRVEHSADDTLIGAMITAARMQVESRTRRALMTQTWRLVLDRWPSSGTIASPASPLREVIAARVRDQAGDAQALDTDIFIANTASSPGLIAFDGRAEFGLIESEQFKLKVSADGESWSESLVSDPATGRVRLPQNDVAEIVLLADQEEYDGLAPPDETTLYLVPDEA